MSDAGKIPIVLTNGCGNNPILTVENSHTKLNIKDETAETILQEILEVIEGA